MDKKIVIKGVGMLTLIILVASIVLFLMWQLNEKIKKDGVRTPYLSEAVYFHIYCPYDWKNVINKDSNQKDEGIYVYVEGDMDEQIYFYYTKQETLPAMIEGDEFLTTDRLKGKMSTLEQDGRVHIEAIFEGNKYGITMNLSDEIWKEHEEKIMQMVESFKITEDTM